LQQNIIEYQALIKDLGQRILEERKLTEEESTIVPFLLT
jgi:hypothetical protein